jgi:8-hydroxy-5-deazaflavin:NADPH oxidoreductase
VKIAIIGSGNVGQALETSLAAAGHSARTTTRGKEAEAVAAAEAVILAVPFSSLDDVTAKIAAVATGKLVIDATNPLKPNLGGLATAGGPSGAELVAARLPGARVAKAFNTLFASILGNPGVHGVEVDALFATDDEKAKGEVASVIRSMGFRPIFVGPLARANEMEALAFLNIFLQAHHGGNWKSTFNLVDAPEKSTQG